MKYYIGKVMPHILMGGQTINDSLGIQVEEDEFWQKIKEILSDKFDENEAAIRNHLSLPDNFIQFRDYKFLVL